MPLYDANMIQQLNLTTATEMNNLVFMQPYVTKVLLTAFPNLAPQLVLQFVHGLLDPSKDNTAFKSHMRDFLITVKEFSTTGDNNQDLFREEAEASLEQLKMQQRSYLVSVPGLISQAEILMDDPDL